MPLVFVNYRTGDEEACAALVERELSRRFGSERIFRASKSIRAGRPWPESLLGAVRSSAVLVAVIGPRWLTGSDGRGGRVIDDEEDWTRREIVEAFAAEVRVIPLLVGRTARLNEADLPSALTALARCQYLRLDLRDVDAGIGRLAEELAAVAAVPGAGAVRGSESGAHGASGAQAGGPAPGEWLEPAFDILGWERYAVGIDHDQLLGVDRIIAMITGFLTGAATGRTLTVSGEGGLGKTTVTYEAVRAAALGGVFSRVVWAAAKNSTFRTGSPDASPTGIEMMDWPDVLHTIAEQVGCELGPSRRLWQEDLRRYVAGIGRDERILLVVDNLEGIHDAEQVVDRVDALGLSRPHKVIATTRWAVRRNDYDVPDVRVRPLSEDDTAALARHIGAGDEQLAKASSRVLAPIFDITEGNPFLVKLIVRRYLRTGRSLEEVIRELTTVRASATGRGGSLAVDVRRYLYEQSLDELAARFDRHAAQRLMASFCFAPRGEAVGPDDLHTWSGIPDIEEFGSLLQAACELALIRPAYGHLRYSIHSLLYEFTCSAPAGD